MQKAKFYVVILAFMLVFPLIFSASSMVSTDPTPAEKKIKGNTAHFLPPILEVDKAIEQYQIEIDKLQEEKAQMLKDIQDKKIARIKEEFKTLEKFICKEAEVYNNKETSELIARSIIKWGDAYGIDPLLILATAIWESRLDQYALGTSMDTGLMQVIPSTGKWIASELGYQWNYEMLYDIDTNIQFGSYYLKINLDYWESKYKFGNSHEYVALIGYNRGTIRSFKEFERGQEVTIYSDKVMPIYRQMIIKFNKFKDN